MSGDEYDEFLKTHQDFMGELLEENEQLKARVKELLSGSARLTAKGNAYLDRAEKAEARVAELENQLASTLSGLRELADAGLITESRAAEIAGVRIEDLRACDATSHGEWTALHLTRIAELQEKLRELESEQALEKNLEAFVNYVNDRTAEALEADDA